jgi:hypothetical protein
MGVRTFSKVGGLGQDFIHHLRDGERYVDHVTAIDNYDHHLFERFETHPVVSSPIYTPRQSQERPPKRPSPGLRGT